MCKTDKPVDWTKPIQSRDGRPARLMGTLVSRAGNDRRDRFVAILAEDGCEESWVQVDHNGKTSRNYEFPYDVINVPPARLTGYVNVYKHPSVSNGEPYLGGIVFNSRAAADAAIQGGLGSNRIARLKIDIEEGHFDE